MYPVLMTQFFGGNKKSRNPVFHDRNFPSKKKERPFRTSTPIPGKESHSLPDFSDSVSELYYRSWQSEPKSSKKTKIKTKNYIQTYIVSYPIWYNNQILYVVPVICQYFYPPGIYWQALGYRSDGTYGVIPMYWPCAIS